MRRMAVLTCAIALMVTSCGSGNETGAANSVPAPTTTAPSSTTTVVEMTGIHVARTDLGSILVDGNGLTLYVLLSDTATTSRRVSGCADVWPPVALDNVGTPGDGLDPSKVGQITRPDGSLQATYADKPLYRYAGDSASADINGQGVDDVWYVIGENGTTIGAPVEDDYGGYDY